MSYLRINVADLPSTKLLSVSRFLSVFDTDGVRVEMTSTANGSLVPGEITNNSSSSVTIVNAAGAVLQSVAVGETVTVANVGVLCDKKGFLFINAKQPLNAVVTELAELDLSSISSTLKASQSERHFEWAHNICMSSGVVKPADIQDLVKKGRAEKKKVSNSEHQARVVNLLQSKYLEANAVFQTRIRNRLQSDLGSSNGTRNRIPVLSFVTNAQSKASISATLASRGDVFSLAILNELRAIDGELLSRMR